MLRKFSYAKKIMLVMGIWGALIIAVGGAFAYIYFKNMIHNNGTNDLEYKMNSTYDLIDTAASVAVRSHLKTIAEDNKHLLRYYHGLVEKGLLTEQEAKAQVKRITLDQVIGKAGYLYYLDSQGTLRVHPTASLINTNISKYDFIKKQIRQKEGYIEYLWQNPGDTKEREKALYMTYFEPWDYIVTASSYKEEFGALLSTQDFRKKVLGTSIGKTGYVYVMDTKGNLIIHPDSQGKNIYDAKDSNGNYFIREMCVNKNGKIQYPWQNPDEKGPREKIVYYRYLEQMDWIIASGVYVDELYAPLKDLYLAVMAWGVLMALFAILGAIKLGRSLSKPILNLAHYAEIIGQGQLDITIPVTSQDEIGALSETFNTMVANLNRFIGKVQHSGVQITASSTELAATAKEHESIMTHQMDSMDKMVDEFNAMSAVSGQLMQTMQHLAGTAEDTASSVGMGQTNLSQMGDAMQSLEKASKAISQRLETINEKTKNITTVVTTITRVAEQTNLLSLNAAIEAEKAGEYGRGFTVVSREIRRLADQTAVATLDIEKMVQAMQSAVVSGVMEMDKFIAEVRNNADDVRQIGNQLRETIENVQTLTPNIEKVNQTVSDQSSTTQQIYAAIMGLRGEMQETKESLNETFSAISQLNEAARTLQDEVSAFSVNDQDDEEKSLPALTGPGQ